MSMKSREVQTLHSRGTAQQALIAYSVGLEVQTLHSRGTAQKRAAPQFER